MPLGTKPKCRKTNVYNNFPYKQLMQIIKTKKILYEQMKTLYKKHKNK